MAADAAKKNEFEKFLDAARASHDPKFGDALASVGDTLTGCLHWFRCHGYSPNPEHLFQMTKMVGDEYGREPLRKPAGEGGAA